ncbi:MAG: ferritin family protein [Akkermansia sp.]
MTKTIENLKAAITGESTASATYAAYAAKAAQEGQPLIQKLFEAASKAESVHAANHNKVLEKLGATMEPIDIQIHVGTTAENLKAAIAGETHEFESMYPEFIAVAEEEGQKAAVRSFTWATEAEKEHADLFRRPEGPGKRRYQPCQAILDAWCAGTPSNLESVTPAPSAAPRLKNSSSSGKLRLSTGGHPWHTKPAGTFRAGFLGRKPAPSGSGRESIAGFSLPVIPQAPFQNRVPALFGLRLSHFRLSGGPGPLLPRASGPGPFECPD